MAKVSSWLESEPAPNVTQLTQDELLDLWMSNRNTMIGRVAAEELARRLYADRKMKK